jgi:hypothetical protein
MHIAMMQSMQQTYGNRAVQRFMQRTPASSPTPVQRQDPQTPPATPPTIAVTREGGEGKTFVSTDTITLKAQVTAAPATGTGGGTGAVGAGAVAGGVAGVAAAGTGVKWTVRSDSANSGTGNPHTEANKETFSFKPNPTGRPTSGSRSPNPPIKYKVDAELNGAKTTFDLEQDETDIIRQEYIDYGTSYKPARADIVTPSDPAFNVGNYSLIVDNGLDTALSSTTSEFATLTQQAAAPAPTPAPTTPPTGAANPAGATAPAGAVEGAATEAAPGAAAAAAAAVPVPALSISSGYRNPQRNKAAGSVTINSRHTQGKALDLTVAGANATLWARLKKAGSNAGYYSICEDGPTEKACSDANVDHVHIQW